MRRRVPLPGDTDSDSTDDEDFAGVGQFSHGVYALSHQHWVDQLVCAGCFSVNNTEGPEAHHKICMRLPSLRVRHLSHQFTTESMLKYMFFHLLFTEMLTDIPVARLRRRTVNISYGVRLPLIHVNGAQVEMKSLSVGGSRQIRNLTSTVLQRTFLHPQVMLARCEVLDLVCSHFGLPRRRTSYTQLECLSWDFGQKLIRPDGKVFWATDSKYPFSYTGAQGCGRRRDVLFLKGQGLVAGQPNQFCIEAVVFFTLGNLSALPFVLPAPVTADVDSGTLTFVLGRWFQAHPHSTERDNCSRPVCPGPLHINNCLWQYSKTTNFRLTLCSRNGDPNPHFIAQHTNLGLTRREAQSHVESNKHAYFGIWVQNRIVSNVNMSPVFKEVKALRRLTTKPGYKL